MSLFVFVYVWVCACQDCIVLTSADKLLESAPPSKMSVLGTDLRLPDLAADTLHLNHLSGQCYDMFMVLNNEASGL